MIYLPLLLEQNKHAWRTQAAWAKREREKERKRERLNDGDNNGQATHGARKHAWRTQAAWAKNPDETHEVGD